MVQIPEKYHDLLSSDVKAFANLATIMENGDPQVTPLWFNYKDGYIWINSAKGRVKDRNMRRHPVIALAISDPKNPYRYIQIRGKVVEMTEQGAEDHIHQLSQKYHGRPFSLTPGQVRVSYKIEPIHVSVNG